MFFFPCRARSLEATQTSAIHYGLLHDVSGTNDVIKMSSRRTPPRRARHAETETNTPASQSRLALKTPKTPKIHNKAIATFAGIPRKISTFGFFTEKTQNIVNFDDIFGDIVNFDDIFGDIIFFDDISSSLTISSRHRQDIVNYDDIL